MRITRDFGNYKLLRRGADNYLCLESAAVSLPPYWKIPIAIY